MADYIEDLQLVNIGNDRDIYVGNYHGTNIWVYNPKTGKSSTLNASGIRRISAMAMGTDGKLYVGSPWERNIWVYDPISKSSKVISASGIQKTGSMAFSSDGKLYVGGEYNNNIWIYDTKDNTSKVVGINVPHRIGSMAFSSDDKLYIGSRGGSNSIAIYDPLTGLTKSGFYPSNISATGSLAFDSNDELYVSNLGRNCRINSYDIKSKRQTWGVTWPCMSRAIKRFAYFDGMALIGNGEIFIGDIFSGRVMQYNRYTGASQYHSAVGIGRAGRTGGITFKNKKTGQESLVTINLILRTKNQYGKDRQFKKKDYHGGNFKIDKTDKYKRDTFSSTVLVRNLAL
jgi:WD40 repeat protein